MKLIRKRVTELKPAEYNPRKITIEAYRGLKTSIDEFGYIEPIVWNKRTGNVVSGHQRLKVLKEAGKKTILVVEIDKTLEEEKALNVTLNNENIRGDWDGPQRELLLPELREFFVDKTKFEALQLSKLSEIKLPEKPELDEKEPGQGKGKGKEFCCPKCGFEWVR